MPTIFHIPNSAAVIRMYFEDHAPPHVHVVDGEDEALVAIQTRIVIRGRVSGRVLDAALNYVAANEAALMQQWAAFGGH